MALDEKLKNVGGKKKLVVILTITSIVIFWVIYSGFEMLKNYVSEQFLTPLLGLESIGNIMYIIEFIIIVLCAVFTGMMVQLIRIGFSINDSECTYIRIKSNEIVADYKDYLEYVPVEKTALVPDFANMSKKAKFFWGVYMLISIIPALESNYNITIAAITIPLLYFVFRYTFDENRRKTSERFLRTVLIILISICALSIAYTTRDFQNGKLGSRILSIGISKVAKFLEANNISIAGEPTFKLAIKLDYRNIDAYVMYADYCEKTGNSGKVESIYKDLQMRNPKEPIVYYKLGLLLKSIKNTKNASEMFQKAIDCNDKYWPAYYEKAEILLSQGHLADAEKLIANVDFQAKDFDSRIFYVKKKILQKKGNYQAALENFYAALESQNKKDDFYQEKAIILLRLGSLEGALKNIDKALELKPNEKNYLYLKSDLLFMQNRVQEAREVYNTILKLDPSETRAIAGVALTEISLGKITRAKEWADQIPDNSQNAYLFFYKSQIYTENKLFDQALKYIDDAIKSNPSQAMFYSYKAEIFHQMGRIDDIPALLTTAKKYNDKEFYIYFVQGNFYIQTGDYKKAIDTFEKCIELNQYFVRAYASKAYACQLVKNELEADNLLNIASMLNDRDYYVYLVKSNIYSIRNMQNLAANARDKSTKLYEGQY